MKKVLFVLFLGMITFGMAACEDSKDWNHVCKGFWDRNFEFEEYGLSSSQLSELKDLYVDACVDINSNLPYCENEYYDYQKCLYIDTSEEYWDEQDEKEEACVRNNNTSEEQEACIEQLFQACRSVDENLDKCGSSHEAELKQYMQSSTQNTYKKIQDKLVEWGIPVDFGSMD